MRRERTMKGWNSTTEMGWVRGKGGGGEEVGKTDMEETPEERKVKTDGRI